MIKFIFISMGWWINRRVIIGVLKIRENRTERLLHIPKIMVLLVYCGKFTAIGPYFFGQWCKCCDREFGALHRNNQQVFCDRIPTKTCDYLTCVVLVGWRDNLSNQSINGCFLTPLRWTPYFQVCWDLLTPPEFFICD